MKGTTRIYLALLLSTMRDNLGQVSNYQERFLPLYTDALSQVHLKMKGPTSQESLTITITPQTNGTGSIGIQFQVLGGGNCGV